MDLKLAKNQTQSYSQWAQITLLFEKAQKILQVTNARGAFEAQRENTNC
jgi:hypothetical protein